ncbi:mitochondrial inner membrane protease subunit 1-like [Saccostrea echinata]|uniref:mitochondrial inner membrane protease subunit 1-like n=1 Tax=Saccostrea echinata TaxID=191078 RepID=UPI002A83F1F1|nr:mitochondrial inner membrane protease subunit 1-like [Saccostrea echinata]
MWRNLFRASMKRGIKGVFQVWCAGCGIMLFANRVAWSINLTGDSMYPTIHSNDKAFIEYMSVSNQRLQKGDIVICKKPYNPTSLVCKRLIGMEHDRIIKEDGQVVKVPKGHVWLEGDNKEDSEDSRDYGPVPYGLLESRVFYRWWPLQRRGFLELPGEVEIKETRRKPILFSGSS